MLDSATGDAVKTATAAYWYFYDGNGNVTEVLQPSVDFAALASLDEGGKRDGRKKWAGRKKGCGAEKGMSPIVEGELGD